MDHISTLLCIPTLLSLSVLGYLPTVAQPVAVSSMFQAMAYPTASPII